VTKLSAGGRLRDVAVLLLAIGLTCGGVLVKKQMLGGTIAQPGEELMYFPSGKFVRQTALGQEATLADIAWLRAVQYYGHHRLTDRKYDMIGHVSDIVTTLDPQFIQAYVFGALVLSQDAGKPYEGLELLRKGMRHNPDNWFLAFETGFIYYVVLRDYRTAGRYFSLSSRLPDAPEFTSRFAAFVEEKAGRTETALKLWEEVAAATENKYIKQIAEEKIAKLKAELEKKTQDSAGEAVSHVRKL
jgi:tetratricopeptide (TPR) repeat protein